MDRKPDQNPEILSLLARSAAARAVLRTEIAKLKLRLDVPGRLRESLQQKPSSWLLGSGVVGLAAGFLFPRFRRTSRPVAAKSTSLSLLGLAWSAARPFAKVWAANQLRSWITNRVQSPTTSIPAHNQTR